MDASTVGALTGFLFAFAVVHYAGAAAAAIVVALLALAAALRPRGWRLPAWSAGLGAVILGAGSVVLPAYASSYGTAWGVVALVWGVAFLGVTEWETRASPDHESLVRGG